MIAQIITAPLITTVAQQRATRLCGSIHDSPDSHVDYDVGPDTLRPPWNVNSQIGNQCADTAAYQHSVRSEVSSQSEVANSAEMMEIDNELCQSVASESLKSASRAEVSRESNFKIREVGQPVSTGSNVQSAQTAPKCRRSHSVGSEGEVSENIGSRRRIEDIMNNVRSQNRTQLHCLLYTSDAADE